ncbi:hypothetical protein LCGC14_2770690, partial [marine sediment metagenome]
MPECKCGCGEWTPNIYIRGHNSTGTSYTHTKESKEEQSLRMQGNQRALGHSVPEESRERIRQARLGVSTLTEDGRRRIVEALTGRPASDYQKQRAQEANTNK